MELSYEKASTEDVETLYNFSKELIDAYEDPSAIDRNEVLAWVGRKLSNKIDEYTCVRCGGETAAWYRFAPAEGKMEIDDLYVLPKYRGRGIGSEIIEKCCRETDLPVFLFVFIKNEGAVRLYNRHGFRVVKKLGSTRYVMLRER